jgi:PKD repeat protein
VEFALVLPVLLLLTLIALDFGRIYLGWVNLQNMARVAANFAANNPTAWASGGTDTITAYRNEILADANAINCTLTPSTPADPTFSDADGDGVTTGIGDHATVTLTCRFQVLTPVISNILGGTVPVTSSAVFPVKNGPTATGGGTGGGGGGCGIPPNPAINAIPTSGNAPLFVNLSDASGGGAGTAWTWDFGDGSPTSPFQDTTHTYSDPGTYVVTLSVTNACGTFTTDPGTTITVGAPPPPTPKLCTVPEFVDHGGTLRSLAQGIWQAAGFTTTVQGPLTDSRGKDYKIKFQDLTGASSVPCDSTINVHG